MSKVHTTVVAIAKDELSAILEWVAYYRVMNVETIVIYDNGSTDGTTELLERLSAKNVLKHVPWPSGDLLSPQRAAYSDAITKFGPDTNWMLFVDMDEFFMPHTTNSVPEAVDSIVNGDDEISGIAINWKTFGTSGLTNRDDRLVIEKFTRCAIESREPNFCVKSIVRPERVQEPHIHVSMFHSGKFVNENAELVTIKDMGISSTVLHSKVQINHYMTKSEEEWDMKRRRGNANRAENDQEKYVRLNDALFARVNRNEGLDLGIHRFLPQVKAEIELLIALIA